MIDTFQKLFLAGLGATATTAEAVKKSLDDMVEKGKISTEEAQEYANKMMEEGKKEFEDAKKEAGHFFQQMMTKANVAAAEDLKGLQARVTALEAEVEKLKAGE
jgi:polyhydroxyalkanoate synthesis regulator phasin